MRRFINITSLPEHMVKRLLNMPVLYRCATCDGTGVETKEVEAPASLAFLFGGLTVITAQPCTVCEGHCWFFKVCLS